MRSQRPVWLQGTFSSGSPRPHPAAAALLLGLALIGCSPDAADRLADARVPPCKPPLFLCEGRCVDTNVDSENCGSCGNRCPECYSCNAGNCMDTAWPPAWKICDGECTSLRGDDHNCGDCGIECVAGASCEFGKCVCDAGLRDCDGQCVDARTDPNNCGGCAIFCVGGLCIDGECRLGGWISINLDSGPDGDSDGGS